MDSKLDHVTSRSRQAVSYCGDLRCVLRMLADDCNSYREHNKAEYVRLTNMAMVAENAAAQLHFLASFLAKNQNDMVDAVLERITKDAIRKVNENGQGGVDSAGVGCVGDGQESGEEAAGD